MSNKPFRIRPHGSPLAAPPSASAPPAARPSVARRAVEWLRQAFGRASLRRRIAQAAIALLLLCLGAAYLIGLSEPAATVLAKKRELPVYCVERADKVLAISFDASWGGDKTLAILDILDEHQVKTTFFLVGIWVDKYPELVREIAARGHEIGNHSNSHAHMSKLSEQQICDELRMMGDKVETLTGVRPTLFRPPYGEYNDRVVLVSRAEGYECVQWSIDSLDWKDRGTADLIKQCTYRVDCGDIVLFHNDSNDILNALPTILEHYQGLGYQIIPVGQLLLAGDYTIDVQGKQHPQPTSIPKQ